MKYPVFWSYLPLFMAKAEKKIGRVLYTKNILYIIRVAWNPVK